MRAGFVRRVGVDANRLRAPQSEGMPDGAGPEVCRCYQRWREYTGQQAVLAKGGHSFEEVGAEQLH